MCGFLADSRSYRANEVSVSDQCQCVVLLESKILGISGLPLESRPSGAAKHAASRVPLDCLVLHLKLCSKVAYPIATSANRIGQRSDSDQHKDDVMLQQRVENGSKTPGTGFKGLLSYHLRTLKVYTICPMGFKPLGTDCFARSIVSSSTQGALANIEK